MKHQMPRISIISVIAALTFGGAVQAADVGRVLLAAGDTVAQRGNETVKLTFGSAVQDKDVLRTGSASNLQVRFIDESIVSMKESSELRIDEFQFSGKEDGSERAFFRLIKGGLRTVTGLIGRTNNKNYQMGTTTASIGIRGTDYSATLCQGDCRNNDGSLAKNGLYGRTHGISHGTNRIDVSNAADSKTFGVNENFYVADAKSLVERLLVSPDFVSGRLDSRKQAGARSDTGGTGTEQATTGGAAAESRPSNTPEPLPQLTFVATQDLNAQGTAAVLAPVNGFVVVYPLSGTASGFFFDDDQLSATVNASNHLTSYGSSGTFPSGSLSGGTITDTGGLTLSNGQTISWGRWTGPTLVTISGGSTISNVPLLFGTATGLENELSGLFGGVATYTYAGGPKPVDAGGNVGSITSTTATIDFTQQTAQITLGMNFPTISGFGPATFNVSGTGTKTQSNLSGDFLGNLSGSCVGSGCLGGGGAASGKFAAGTTGPNGYDFSVFGGLVSGTQVGDVAFLNAYLASSFTPGPPPASSKAIQFTFTDTPSTIGTGSQGVSPSFTLSPPLLTQFSFPSPSGVQMGTLLTGTVVESTPAASPAVQANALAAGNMQWGRWTGSFLVTNGPNPPQTPGSGLHYIYGDISSNLPTTGSAIFSYIGGTNPTNSSGQVGTFTGGAFNVNFVNQAITISTPLTFTMPGGLSYTMSACTTCAYGGPQAGFIVPGSTLTGMCTGGSCSTGFPATGQLNGGLTGVGGTGMMTTSAINTTAPGVPITTFAAGFKR